VSVFDPQPGQRIHIGDSTYEFESIRLLPGDEPVVDMIEGQEGFIYVLHEVDRGTRCVLKALKTAYRGPHSARITAGLAQYWSIPGFYLCNRVCLVRPTFDALITMYPALEYALFMPWLSWKTWAGLIRSPQVSAAYTRSAALDLAGATARVLCEIEQRGCAHTDIAGGNIMYSPDFKQVQLLDLEGFYLPDIPRPERVSRGSPGYQHRKLGRQGQWTNCGDRFAAAILLTEMLTWWYRPLREQMPDNATTLFLPEELQMPTSPRLKMVREILWWLNPALVALFDQAWVSPRLNDCPECVAWLSCLNAVNHRAVTAT
jgi:hypothetical protein